MKNSNFRDDKICEKMQPLLSEYVDNALSARESWELEKHLAVCTACAELSAELQQTVRLLRSAERRDTSDDFMASLHARLDGVEPDMAGPRPFFDTTRNWLSGVSAALWNRRAPVLGLSMATTALVALFMVTANRTPDAPKIIATMPDTHVVQEQLQRNVALAANNPFGDPAAANLDAHFNGTTPASSDTDNVLE